MLAGAGSPCDTLLDTHHLARLLLTTLESFQARAMSSLQMTLIEPPQVQALRLDGMQRAQMAELLKLKRADTSGILTLAHQNAASISAPISSIL